MEPSPWTSSHPMVPTRRWPVRLGRAGHDQKPAGQHAGQRPHRLHRRYLRSRPMNRKTCWQPAILRAPVPGSARQTCSIRAKPRPGPSPRQQRTIPLHSSPPRSRVPTTSTAMRCNRAIQGPPSSARPPASQQDPTQQEPRTQPHGRRWLAHSWPRTPSPTNRWWRTRRPGMPRSATRSLWASRWAVYSSAA